MQLELAIGIALHPNKETAIYAALSSYFSTLFFPKSNETASFLASLVTFGVGLLVRPPGATLFGGLGNIVGRKDWNDWKKSGGSEWFHPGRCEYSGKLFTHSDSQTMIHQPATAVHDPRLKYSDQIVRHTILHGEPSEKARTLRLQRLVGLGIYPDPAYIPDPGRKLALPRPHLAQLRIAIPGYDGTAQTVSCLRPIATSQLIKLDLVVPGFW
ncbi:hypothetical protein [Burkholderia sp. WAC0059]|uniref:hypothetical protein n=1 Tax=Burkholderia sp. WAC0059 TaxID=2066022 RepID=UPI0027E3C487|nr:hypothetical protein [Burkholderia sp. WAC0059]